jgi:hypothetical protein
MHKHAWSNDDEISAMKSNEVISLFTAISVNQIALLFYFVHKSGIMDIVLMSLLILVRPHTNNIRVFLYLLQIFVLFPGGPGGRAALPQEGEFIS